ncbi:hypothetical protein V2J09_000976 [Rumex salicifolius]
MSLLQLNSNSNANVSSKQPENGASQSASTSSISSEKVVEELLQNPVQGLDEHLVEFSEAIRIVTKTLRRVTEGKAAAQAEATEWKRKYELERAKNLRLELRDLSTVEAKDALPDDGATCMISNPIIHEADGNIGNCCGKNGICNHEVLRDSVADFKSKLVDGDTIQKASFKLTWNCKSDQSNQYKHNIVSFAQGDIVTAERSSKQISLKWETSPQTVLVLTKPNSVSVRILCAEMIRWLSQKKLNIYVEPHVRSELLHESSEFDFIQTWKDEEEISNLHMKVDLVVTLGGDGTVLWAASMFKGPVPPIVPFSLGSLGFMTPYHSENYKESLDSILMGPVSIILRHRLQCHLIRDAAKNEYETEGPILVLNEVTIDRGISSFLTNLECYCDHSFVTTVQGDGLILSTTSGSTAYSLAAGGSMVHPQVPGILFTPICPHSLSFRPLILPEHVTLRVQVPLNSRSPAWVSFDGKGRKKLEPGDMLLCSMAPWPVPTSCQVDLTGDFLRSVHEGLHWNLRKTQSFDGPDDA